MHIIHLIQFSFQILLQQTIFVFIFLFFSLELKASPGKKKKKNAKKKKRKEGKKIHIRSGIRLREATEAALWLPNNISACSTKYACHLTGGINN